MLRDGFAMQIQRVTLQDWISPQPKFRAECVINSHKKYNNFLNFSACYSWTGLQVAGASRGGGPVYLRTFA